MSLCVVIPAFNEDASIGRVVQGIKQLDLKCEIVVVDDNSSDYTRQEAQKHGAVVLRLCDRLGPWGATQTGFRFAYSRGFDKIITMDADGQHLPAMVPRLLDLHASSNANVVVGSATSRGSQLKLFAWRFLKWTSGLGVTDPTSGFRLYDKEAVRLTSGFKASCLKYQDVGVLALALDNGLLITEVEVEMKARVHGSSRIFKSWFSIIYYMAHALILGFSKRSRKGLLVSDLGVRAK